jgi:hypothetical protein
MAQADAKQVSDVALPPKSIKLVLFDMDLTLLAKHTQGVYTGNISTLAMYVTEAFRQVVPVLLDNGKY